MFYYFLNISLSIVTFSFIFTCNTHGMFSPQGQQPVPVFQPVPGQQLPQGQQPVQVYGVYQLTPPGYQPNLDYSTPVPNCSMPHSMLADIGQSLTTLLENNSSQTTNETLDIVKENKKLLADSAEYRNLSTSHLENIKQDLNTINHQVEHLKEELNATKKSIADLNLPNENTKKHDLNEEMENQLKRFEESTKKIVADSTTELKDLIEKSITDISTESRSNSKALSNKITSNDKKLDKLTSDISEQQKTFNSFSKKLQAIEGKQQNSNERLGKLSDDSIHKDILGSEIYKIKSGIDQLNTELQEFLKLQEHAKTNNDETTRKNNTFITDTFNSHLDEIKLQFDELKKEVKTINKNVDGLTLPLSREVNIISEKFTDMENQQQEIKEKLQEQNTNLATIITILKDLPKNIQERLKPKSWATIAAGANSIPITRAYPPAVQKELVKTTY